MTDLISGGADKASRRAAKEQREQIARQKQQESVRLAEQEDELARRKSKAASGRFGRRSLITTSPTGVTKGETTELGG